MESKKLVSREDVVSYLMEKTKSSYKESFDMVEELEKFNLVRFLMNNNYSLKKLTKEKPEEPEKYYSMPKELVLNPEFKTMSADSKFAYTFLFHEYHNQGGL